MRRSALVPRVDEEVRERRIAAVLLGATCASVYTVYLLQWQVGPWIDGTGGAAWRALGFAGCLVSILVCHELGHWLVGRAYGLRLALPWFLPAPILVGTFGAVIRWSDTPRDRTSLLAMAAGGPLAGFGAVVLALLAWSLTDDAEGAAIADAALARPALWWIVSGLTSAQAPTPISTQDPLGFAAWIGALVTAMNLMPIGQLDGGHIVAALWPERARLIGRVTTAALLLLGLWWPMWAVWAALANLLGASEPPRATGPPDATSRRMAAACGVAWLLCFTPVPTL